MNLKKLSSDLKKRSLKTWIHKQYAKDRCGLWPLHLPKIFDFTVCCKLHDDGYEELRATAFEQNINFQQLEATVDIYMLQIVEIDDFFIKCMERRIKLKPLYSKWFYWSFYKVAKKIVRLFGWDIWRYITLDRGKELYSSK